MRACHILIASCPTSPSVATTPKIGTNQPLTDSWSVSPIVSSAVSPSVSPANRQAFRDRNQNNYGVLTPTEEGRGWTNKARTTYQSSGSFSVSGVMWLNHSRNRGPASTRSELNLANSSSSPRDATACHAGSGSHGKELSSTCSTRGRR